MKLVAGLALTLMTAAAGQAQSDARIRASSQEHFLAQARAAALRYIRQEDALLDGYRPIGPELPAMGRHWLNPEYANMGYVDPARPAFLLYVTIAGQPQLGGVGYTLPLQRGEKLPTLPAHAHAWHEHAGSVADEAFSISHHSVDDESRFRVVALHIWHALPAPDGLFAAENWNLPFLRNGLQPPTQPNRSAAMMLALTNGGHEYYAELVRRHTGVDEATAALVRELFARFAEEAAAWAAQARTNKVQRTETLSAGYEQLWSELARLIPSAQLAKVSELKQVRE
jgi:hypothetical protein